jgi:hypothetical protein
MAKMSTYLQKVLYHPVLSHGILLFAAWYGTLLYKALL